jgi:ABC-type hemin transport system ATPase subunit
MKRQSVPLVLRQGILQIICLFKQLINKAKKISGQLLIPFNHDHWDIQVTSILSAHVISQLVCSGICLSRKIPVMAWTQALSFSPTGLTLGLGYLALHALSAFIIRRRFYPQSKQLPLMGSNLFSQHKVTKTHPEPKLSNDLDPAKVFSTQPASIIIDKPFSRLAKTHSTENSDAWSPVWTLDESIHKKPLVIKPGTHLFLGKNGAGKSTVIEALNETIIHALHEKAMHGLTQYQNTDESSDSLPKSSYFEGNDFNTNVNLLGVSQMQFGKASTCTSGMMKSSCFTANNYLQFLITEHLDPDTAQTITQIDQWPIYEKHITKFLTETCKLPSADPNNPSDNSVVARLLKAGTDKELGRPSGGEMQMINAAIIHTLMTLKRPNTTQPQPYYNCIVLDEPCQAIDVEKRTPILKKLAETANTESIVFITVLHEDKLAIIEAFDHIHDFKVQSNDQGKKTVAIHSIDISDCKTNHDQLNNRLKAYGLHIIQEPKLARINETPGMVA